MTTTQSGNKSMLSQLFNQSVAAKNLQVNPLLLDKNTGGAWLSKFRMSAVEQSRGVAMSAVQAFETAMDQSAPVKHVHAAFLTACAVLEANLGKVEQCKLLEGIRASKAHRAITDLLEESGVAYNRLGTKMSQAVSLDQYSAITESAHARLVSLYEYLESLTRELPRNETLPGNTMMQTP